MQQIRAAPRLFLLSHPEVGELDESDIRNTENKALVFVCPQKLKQ